MTEEEIKQLLKTISVENEQLRKIYYAQNTPVIQVKHRKFPELFKKFVVTIKEENGFPMLQRQK
ncbi:MAG: hypothetical protein LUH07_05000 [Lachnospiraceae bacterium]|nr:hypothetical protein [Lachnospiraceae bacterium]